MAKKTQGRAPAVRVAAEALALLPIDDLVPYAKNARTHGPEQIARLRASLREFGFVTPILVDKDNNVIAGHGRLEAARAEGMREVPCVLVSDLTEAQRRAYILADNRLAELSGWDFSLVELEMAALAGLEFDTGVVGFDLEEPGSDRDVPVSAYTRAAPGAGEDAEALDLEDGPEREGPKAKVYHCPKCGFEFEARS